MSHSSILKFSLNKKNFYILQLFSNHKHTAPHHQIFLNQSNRVLTENPLQIMFKIYLKSRKRGRCLGFASKCLQQEELGQA